MVKLIGVVWQETCTLCVQVTTNGTRVMYETTTTASYTTRTTTTQMKLWCNERKV